MNAINFIKRYKKEYIGDIDNSYLDNENNNYIYYQLLLHLSQEKEYVLFSLDKKDNKYYLKIIKQSDNDYILDNKKLYCKYNKEEAFNYKILLKNNKLKIRFDISEILDYMSYPNTEYYLLIPYEYNYITEININNNINYDHPYGGSLIKKINIYLQYMPNLIKLSIKNGDINYIYKSLINIEEETNIYSCIKTLSQEDKQRLIKQFPLLRRINIIDENYCY